MEVIFWLKFVIFKNKNTFYVKYIAVYKHADITRIHPGEYLSHYYCDFHLF